MQLTERHVIKVGHHCYSEIDKLCFLSKNLYNAATYLVRQSFIHQGLYLNYYEVQKQMQGSVDYKALPAKVAQQILMVIDRNWKSFFEATKSYEKDPSRFTGKPKIPRYKPKLTGRNLVIYTSQALSKPALAQQLIKPSKTNLSIPTRVANIAQVRLVPKLDHYVVEVVYDKLETQAQVNPQSIASIDLGLNNLAAVTFNQAGIVPLLINGRPLKSINQYFNKKLAKLQGDNPHTTSRRIRRLCTKRNHKVDDYLHKASRYVIDLLISLGVGTLVIGYNEQWKQEINLGKRNNQNFVQIPHTRFIEQLRYKAALVGIRVIVREESYTSKASFLDLDKIPTYGQNKGKVSFKGTRVKRGLYRSSSGRLINADTNGSYNIMRKVVPNAFAKGIEGVVVHPVKITLPN